jgi:hypothetical protein
MPSNSRITGTHSSFAETPVQAISGKPTERQSAVCKCNASTPSGSGLGILVGTGVYDGSTSVMLRVGGMVSAGVGLGGGVLVIVDVSSVIVVSATDIETGIESEGWQLAKVNSNIKIQDEQSQMY